MGTRSLVKKFEVKLDLKRPSSNREFEVVYGDTGNSIEIQLSNDGVSVPLTGYRVAAVFSNSNGTFIQDSSDTAGGLTISDDKVIIELFPTSAAPGLVECELQIYTNGAYSPSIDDTIYVNLVTSAKFNFSCRKGILNDATMQAISQYPVLMRLMDTIDEAEEERNDSELLRVSAESKRITNETARATAETARASAETTRASAETARASAETARASAESTRTSAESTRASAESTRASAETNRISTETARAAAEAERSSILRGAIASSSSAGSVSPLNNITAKGWYEYEGGIILVNSPITSELSRVNCTVYQTNLSATGVVRKRTGLVSNGNVTWSEWTIPMSGKENIANKVTAVSASSTDTEYPSAKCVYTLTKKLFDDYNDLYALIKSL